VLTALCCLVCAFLQALAEEDRCTNSLLAARLLIPCCPSLLRFSSLLSARLEVCGRFHTGEFINIIKAGSLVMNLPVGPVRRANGRLSLAAVRESWLMSFSCHLLLIPPPLTACLRFTSCLCAAKFVWCSSVHSLSCSLCARRTRRIRTASCRRTYLAAVSPNDYSLLLAIRPSFAPRVSIAAGFTPSFPVCFLQSTAWWA
jgi:hypothetical protein